MSVFVLVCIPPIVSMANDSLITCDLTNVSMSTIGLGCVRFVCNQATLTYPV